MRRTLAAWFVAFGAVGCGTGLGECPPDSMAAQLAGRQVIEQRCVTCHSSTVTGQARQQAPVDINFNTLAGVRQELQTAWGEVNDGTMPPSAALSAADVESVRVFLACDAPDVK